MGSALLERPGIDEAATAFLIDAGMDQDALSRILGLKASDMRAVLDGRGAPEGARTAIDRLAAIQSLLLTGYSPTRAAEWLNHSAPALSGRTPIEALEDGDDVAVLRAAYDRVSS